MPLHPAQRRFLAEQLVRLRRSDEQRRYASPQRAAKVDANPHQVDAVIFALARLGDNTVLLSEKYAERTCWRPELFACGAWHWRAWGLSDRAG